MRILKTRWLIPTGCFLENPLKIKGHFSDICLRIERKKTKPGRNSLGIFIESHFWPKRDGEKKGKCRSFVLFHGKEERKNWHENKYPWPANGNKIRQKRSIYKKTCNFEDKKGSGCKSNVTSRNQFTLFVIRGFLFTIVLSHSFSIWDVSGQWNEFQGVLQFFSFCYFHFHKDFTHFHWYFGGFLNSNWRLWLSLYFFFSLFLF